MMEAKICVNCGFKDITSVICPNCGKLPLNKDAYTCKTERRINSVPQLFMPSHFSMFGDLLKISADGFWIRGVKVEQ